jgi:Icc-related predicted phosphoesterase
MQLSWVTDPHLEFLDGPTLDSFMERLAGTETDGVIISGDISYAKRMTLHLKRLSELPMPVYFVLGNHDFYHGSFEIVHKMVRAAVKESQNLTWLTEALPIQLTDQTYLIGHDGWADGRGGMGQKSGLILNDYRLISDFAGLSVGSVFDLMQKKADIASKRLYQQIHQIGAKHIIVVTHAPPFREASKYQGRIADDRSMPHFSNLGMGEALREAVQEAGAKLSIVCGHSHCRAEVALNRQIRVKAGEAQYGKPRLSIIDVDRGLFYP